MAAERDAMDRYVAAFLSDKEGAEFEGRITGVTRFGLFVKLDESGRGRARCRSRPWASQYWIHDERTHALVAERSGERYRLGTRVTVRLKEATPLTGGLAF